MQKEPMEYFAFLRLLLAPMSHSGLKKYSPTCQLQFFLIAFSKQQLGKDKFFSAIFFAEKKSKNVFLQFFAEYHPNVCFSEITFLSGFSLWSLEIEKRSLMGCLFFDAQFFNIFILAD